MPRTSPIRFFAIRITIEENWKPYKVTFNEWCEELAEHYIFQVENTTENFHIQAYMKTEEKKRDSALLKQLIELFPGCSCYCKPVATEGKRALERYCMKEESRVAGPWADSETYMGQDLIQPAQFNPFQKDCYEMFLWLLANDGGDDRRSDWFLDILGEGGKTKIAKWLAWKFPKKVCLITAWKAWDILKIAAAHPNRLLYIINLSKAKPGDIAKQDLYNAIEGIKDGAWADTKGTAKQVFMNSAQVWIMANHPPARSEMAQNRFTVRRVPRPPEKYRKKPVIYRMRSCPVLSEAELDEIEADLAIENGTSGMDESRGRR